MFPNHGLMVKLFVHGFGGPLNVMMMFCEPVGAFVGIANVQTTMLVAGCEMPVPLMVPANMTVGNGALSGGLGGGTASVLVTVTVVPREALPPGEKLKSVCV